MAVATLVSLEEYLDTSYEPDREYVDGCLIERNVGELNHGFLQFNLGIALKAHGLRVYTASRTRVAPRRFRVPDVLALAPGQKRGDEFQIEPPFIAIEILSRNDRIAELRDKLQDYFAMPIPNIWVVDPVARTLTVHHPTETHTFTDRVTTSDGSVSIDLEDIFRQLAEDEAQ
jgi:Uma2 family endonuclease